MAIQTILSKGLSIGLAAVGPIIGRIVPMSPIVATGLSIGLATIGPGTVQAVEGYPGTTNFPEGGPYSVMKLVPIIAEKFLVLIKGRYPGG